MAGNRRREAGDTCFRRPVSLARALLRAPLHADARAMLHSARSAAASVKVTGNAKKLEEIKAILGGSAGGAPLVSKKVDLPELQGEPRDIVREKCALAAKDVQVRA